jgi:hypothetical protein
LALEEGVGTGRTWEPQAADGAADGLGTGRRTWHWKDLGAACYGASSFVKLGIPTCVSCCVISFCLFLHLPKGYVNDVQHLRHIPSRSEATVAYVESGDATGPVSARQVHPCYQIFLDWILRLLVAWLSKM